MNVNLLNAVQVFQNNLVSNTLQQRNIVIQTVTFNASQYFLSDIHI